MIVHFDRTGRLDIACGIRLPSNTTMNAEDVTCPKCRAEVRRPGAKDPTAELAAAVGYDRNKFIERLRQNQNNSNRKVVSFAKKRQETPGSESR